VIARGRSDESLQNTLLQRNGASPGMRLLLLLPCALLLVPGVSASPDAYVGIGPDGPTQDPDGLYYVIVHVTQPETPHEGSADQDDCASGDRPENVTEVIDGLLPPLLGINPHDLDSPSPYVPRCIPLPFDGCTPAVCLPVALYASYNVTSGRYYAEATMPEARMMTVGYTGTSGAGVEADCVGCPPFDMV
jgi:hypothetical protein